MKDAKIIGKEKMFCSICEKEHEVELIEEEREVKIRGKRIKHKEKLYRCNKYNSENTFETGVLWDKNLNRLKRYTKTIYGEKTN